MKELLNLRNIAWAVTVAGMVSLFSWWNNDTAKKIDQIILEWKDWNVAEYPINTTTNTICESKWVFSFMDECNEKTSFVLEDWESEPNILLARTNKAEKNWDTPSEIGLSSNIAMLEEAMWWKVDFAAILSLSDSFPDLVTKNFTNKAGDPFDYDPSNQSEQLETAKRRWELFKKECSSNINTGELHAAINEIPDDVKLAIEMAWIYVINTPNNENSTYKSKLSTWHAVAIMEANESAWRYTRKVRDSYGYKEYIANIETIRGYLEDSHVIESIWNIYWEEIQNYDELNKSKLFWLWLLWVWIALGSMSYMRRKKD